MLRSRSSLWSAASALLCLIILAATWFVLIAPRRSDAADLRQRNASAQRDNDLLQARIAQLQAQYADLPARRAELASVLAQLPAEAEVPALLRQLSAIAGGTGMVIDGITPGTAKRSDVAGDSGTSGSQTSGSGASSSQTSGSSASGSGTASASKAGGSPGTSKAGGSPGTSKAGGPPGTSKAGGSPGTSALALVQVPLSVVMHGDYFQAVAFLQQMQTKMKRALLVTGVQVEAGESAGSASGQVQVTVTGQLFVLAGDSAPSTSASGASGSDSTATGSTGAVTQPAPTSASATGTGGNQ